MAESSDIVAYASNIHCCGSSDEGQGGGKRRGGPAVRPPRGGGGGGGGEWSEDEFERDMESELMGVLQTVTSPDALAAATPPGKYCTLIQVGRSSLSTTPNRVCCFEHLLFARKSS